MNTIQGTKMAGKLWNDRLNAVLDTLEIKRCASDYGVYVWFYEGDLVLLNLSTDDILVATNNEEARTKIEEVLKTYFEITPDVNPTEFHYLNWRII